MMRATRRLIAGTLVSILGASIFSLATTGQARATEWIFCRDSRSTVELGLLLGWSDTISIAGATLTHGAERYTTDPVNGEGEFFRLRTVLASRAGLRAAFVAAAGEMPFGQISLKAVKRGDSNTYRGRLSLTGGGSWAVSCDDE